MNLFIYTGASRLNAAVVESATDLTAVSRLPDLIVGDSEPVTVKFLSASGAFESWSGGGTYTLSISIGALGGDGIAAYFQTSSFTAVTNGWTGRLNLASGSLPSVVAGYLAERPGAQSVPLFVQVRVTDADGNTETYARQAVSISGAVSVPTTANSTPVTYATAADVAADASTASAAAIAAAASASAAAGSASTAAGHVTTAGNSATAAAASAVTAGNSATTASGHATTATTQATNAATSASSAGTYKDAAAVSAASATSSAGTATTQAALATTNGAAQVTLAAAQVTLATTQATNAGTSASAAAISAAAALVSEAAALVSKNAAAASAATASAVSGSGNGTFSAAALTGVDSLTASASTALTLTGGSTGASLVLGHGAAAANATLSATGTGRVVTTPVMQIGSAYNVAGTLNTLATVGTLTLSDNVGFNLSNADGTRNLRASLFLDATNYRYGLQSVYSSASDFRFVIRQSGVDQLQVTQPGNLLIGTTTDITSAAGSLKINGTGTGATATGATNGTGGLQSPNFGLSTVSGGASYFGGVLNVGDGSVSVPAYSFGADTNSGWYRGGGDAVRLALGGVETLNMDLGASIATAVMQWKSTLSASSSLAGALRVGDGTTAATNVAIGGGNVNAGGAGTFAGAVTISRSQPALNLANTGAGGATWNQYVVAASGNLAIDQEGVINALTFTKTTALATFGGSISTAGTVTATSAGAHTFGTTNTVSFTAGKISQTAVSTDIFSSTGATTSGRWLRLTNTGGDAYIGIESSAGGSLLTGATPYATVITSATGVPVQIGTGDTLRATFSATGTTFAGAVSASGTAATWTSGTGSPESVKTAPVGSLYTRTDGGASTTLYVKESGAGNTGWIAK